MSLKEERSVKCIETSCILPEGRMQRQNDFLLCELKIEKSCQPSNSYKSCALRGFLNKLPRDITVLFRVAEIPEGHITTFNYSTP